MLPSLYIKYISSLEPNEISILDFPPAGKSSDYQVASVWDLKFKTLKYTHNYNGIKGGKSALALNLF